MRESEVYNYFDEKYDRGVINKGISRFINTSMWDETLEADYTKQLAHRLERDLINCIKQVAQS